MEIMETSMEIVETSMEIVENINGNCGNINGNCGNINGNCGNINGNCGNINGNCGNINGNCGNINGYYDYQKFPIAVLVIEKSLDVFQTALSNWNYLYKLKFKYNFIPHLMSVRQNPVNIMLNLMMMMQQKFQRFNHKKIHEMRKDIYLGKHNCLTYNSYVRKCWNNNFFIQYFLKHKLRSK